MPKRRGRGRLAVTKDVPIMLGGKEEFVSDMVPKLRLAAMKDAPIKGAKVIYPLCSHEGCTKYAQVGGVCMRHGEKIKKLYTCSHEGCNKYERKGGVCIRHGAKQKQKTCSHEGCTNNEIYGGVCWMHGESSTIKPIH